MKKIISVLLLCVFTFQSCTVTKYVRNENILRRDFNNAMADDVKFKMGEPDSIDVFNNGYAYTYYYDVTNSKREIEQKYERFSFDSDDNLRNIQSNNVVKQKRVSVGGTIAVSILLPVAFILILAAYASY